MKSILSRVSSNNCFVYVKTLPVMCQEPVPSWQFWVALSDNKHRLVTSIALFIFLLICNEEESIYSRGEHTTRGAHHRLFSYI